MRRSRRNGQLRRTSSMRARSISATRISSRSGEPCATITPWGSATKERSPELDARAAAFRRLVPDAVDRGDVEPVGDRVAALHGDPGVALGRAVLGLLVRMPADGGGIEEDFGAGERRQACPLRIPLVPADERGDAPGARVERGEAQVARREIELLVVGRVVGDVHLAVEAEQLPVGVEDRGAVVVQARRPPLEDRGHNDLYCWPGRLRTAAVWSAPAPSRPGRTSPGPPAGRSTGTGRARGGTRPRPRGGRRPGRSRRRVRGSPRDPAAQAIWTRPTRKFFPRVTAGRLTDRRRRRQARFRYGAPL